MRRTWKATSPPRDVDAALEAMGAAELRDVVREMLDELDDRTRGRVVSSLISRATRGSTGWVPEAPSNAEVDEVTSFAAAAERVGHADPRDVDERLRRGQAAFLRKDYVSAYRIFGALLLPMSEGNIDLGQHEMFDEVLGVDASECASQYVASVYMTTAPGQRAEAVRTAIDEVRGAGHFFEPIREMERVTVQPLPELDAFFPQWRAIVEKEANGQRHSDWDTEANRWLREVVRRTEGAAGLAKVARASKRAEDLRAWCASLSDAHDWKAASAAFEEAAELIASKDHHSRGEFFDGAALAAQELGTKDLSPCLERAWRAEPTLLRLRRWLGAARCRSALRERAADALAGCPKQANRQRAFLHVLQGDLEPATRLLTAAPGLGWSSDEHPGHLLFPLFQALLAGIFPTIELSGHFALEERVPLTAGPDEPRLGASKISELLRLAGIEGVPDDKSRRAVLAAMRAAAEKRVSGVTEEKRRQHYGHAASLVAICVARDGSADALRWAASVGDQHKRFPAFRAELQRHLKSS